MTDIQRPLAGFTLHPAKPEVRGINFFHSIDRAAAIVGETLTFTAWVLNPTDETLTNVSLHLRSLTNDRLNYLSYGTTPTAKEITGRTLVPRQSLSYTLTYTATSTDALEDGLLVSALRVELTSPSLGKLRSECDAEATVLI